jgi:Zn-dependent protease
MKNNMQSPNQNSGYAGLAAVGSLILSKLKFVVVGLKFFKLGKIGGSFITMGVMAWTYSHRHGWPFAVGIVLSILIHEIGHCVAAYSMGVSVSAPIFIPFFGAFITLKEKAKSFYEEFVIAAGGPIAGSAAALICLILSKQYPEGSTFLLALGYFTLTMNLFNLVPIGFLDGSRMTSCLEWTEWLIGTIALLCAHSYLNDLSDIQNPMTFAILVLGFIKAGSGFYQRVVQNQVLNYVSLDQRLSLAFAYFGFTGFLIYMAERTAFYLEI